MTFYLIRHSLIYLSESERLYLYSLTLNEAVKQLKQNKL